MASTFTVPRGHLIYGACLPLAVLLGYLLAEPMESASLAVVVMVFSVIFVPVLMRWHHPLLIFGWNASIVAFFLPGRPAIWVLLAFVSFFWGLLNRSVNPANRFLYVPSLTRSLMLLLGVVAATAFATGGVGIRSLGSESSYGGRGYVYLLAAVVGYFAFTSQAIPRSRAHLYTALFFLSGTTAIVSNLAYVAGPGFYFLYDLFPPEFAWDQFLSEGAVGPSINRIAGLTQLAPAVFACVLARYGIRGLFDATRPWRMALFLAAPFASLFGGYRATFVFIALTFGVLFIVEGLWRTRYLFAVVCGGLLVGAAFLPFLDKMPLSVQRTLSFLPVEIDPWAKLSAQASTEWRLEMWRAVLPEVPRRLLKGRGYALNPQDVEMIPQTHARGFEQSGEWAALSGDYHNGPLSVVMPFGIYGLIAFVWFLGAGVRVLHRNHRYGDPGLRTINAFLLAAFVARILFFTFVFGALYSDLFQFTGLLGLSVALNGGVRRPGEESQFPETRLERQAYS